MTSLEKIFSFRVIVAISVTLGLVAPTFIANAQIPKNKQTHGSASDFSIEAAHHTHGTYGDLYKLKMPSGDGVELDVVSFLSPMGKVSGSYFADPMKVKAVTDAVENYRFHMLSKTIATKDPVPFHSPEYQLTIISNGKAHSVRLYAPEYSLQTDESQRFVAVWTAVFDLVPMNVRPPQIRFKNTKR